jgi:ubiquinone/menaquinone biosynthesis C-methylase UbiE
LTNVEFQEADAEKATLPAACFDFVLCSNGMGYLQDIPAALKRFHGWLKPGGKVVFNNPQVSYTCLSAILSHKICHLPRLCRHVILVACAQHGCHSLMPT